jgi:hypothetical protein
MPFEPNKARDLQKYVYIQSKTFWISSRLIQMGINMLTGEMLISV